jgi:hypothetical protein
MLLQTQHEIPVANSPPSTSSLQKAFSVSRVDSVFAQHVCLRMLTINGGHLISTVMVTSGLLATCANSNVDIAMEEHELVTLRTQIPNGRSFSDGDIYRNLRYCQLHAPSQTPFWRSQLSDTKRTDLEQLSSPRNAPLQSAIDSLIPYVGEWQSFPLGVLHRLLTSKANKASSYKSPGDYRR